MLVPALLDAARTAITPQPISPNMGNHGLLVPRYYLWLINTNLLPYMISWFARGWGSLLRALILEKKL